MSETTWADIAIAMLDELRQDYAPMALGDGDGRAAIAKLRAQVATLRAERDELIEAVDATLDRERETADLAVKYEAERDAALAEVARLNNLQAIRDDAQLHYYREAERRVRQYGVEPGWLQCKWRTNPPANFDQQECAAAVLDALNREGVPAGDGDAVGCVVQIVEAQAKQRDELRALLLALYDYAGGPSYELPDGKGMVPGMDRGTLGDVFAALWPEGKAK